jgi:predicted acylesterase/phospholipase RssA
MRGVYTAAFLAGLSDLFARERGGGILDIGKAFDLIVGTSTGAIVGCAAAIGRPMAEVVQLYRQHGPKIFPQRLKAGFGILGQIPSRSRHLKKGAVALEGALKSVLKDATFRDVSEKRGIALSIPAVEMSQQRAWVFKTDHWGGHRDDHTTLVNACLATSAAPIFRSLAALPVDDGLEGYRVFADGGLWANNPVLVGLLDAIKMDADRPVEVFAAGTCPKPEGERIAKNDLDRGLIAWKFGGAAAQLSIAAQEFAFDNMARLFAGEFTRMGRRVDIVRFPRGVLQPSLLPYLDIDNTSVEAMEALIDQARADVNIAKSACDDDNDNSGRLIRDVFASMPIMATGDE